jgi:hypothetical protein
MAPFAPLPVTRLVLRSRISATAHKQQPLVATPSRQVKREAGPRAPEERFPRQ